MLEAKRNAPVPKRLWQWGLLIALAAVVVWARSLLWQAALQLFFGMLVSLLAMPIMKRLENRMPVGLAATLSMLVIAGVLLGALILLVPFLAEQVRQLVARLPALFTLAGEWLQKGEQWLLDNGILVDTEMKNALLANAQTLASRVGAATMQRAGGMLSSLSKLMLAPAFAFYFLRDRKRIGGWLLMLLPVSWRDTSVRMLREMRRETAGFIRGQLLVSAVVGALTGLGLLLIGMPSWLLMGLAMAVLEIIPYAGPFLGGALIMLFALQDGLSRALWALGVVVVVQQLESGMVSPKLMSDATRLHPVAVLLCVMLGGMASGIMGILLSIPLLLCFRAALRVLSLRMAEAEGIRLRPNKTQ